MAVLRLIMVLAGIVTFGALSFVSLIIGIVVNPMYLIAWVVLSVPVGFCVARLMGANSGPKDANRQPVDLSSLRHVSPRAAHMPVSFGLGITPIIRK